MFNVKSLKEKIISDLKKVIEKKYGADVLQGVDFELEDPPEIKLGDFSFNCFKLAKALKTSPTETAKTLAHLIKPQGIIEKVINAGPYLNFFLNQELWYKETLDEVLELKEKYGEENIGQDKNILIEFSAPNTNKPQHLGHLRNALLGMSLTNLFKSLGYKAIRTNLVNDRGIHISKSMLAYKLWGENKTPSDTKEKPDHFVGYFYSLFDKKSKENPKIIEEAQAMLKKWEDGDQETWQLWQKMNKWAMEGFHQTYKKIGVEFDKWYYESEIYKLGRGIVLEALNKNLCYRREDGTVEIDLSEYNLDKKVLIRADGTSIYVTQDLGLAKLKFDDYKPERSIYVIGSEQKYYFKVLFKILDIFGFSWVKQCYHLSYGLVFLPEGRMKSREGKIVEIDDFVQSVQQIAKGEILKREKEISPVELETRAEKIASASLKFFFLKFTPEEDIYYDPKKEVSFEGATGPYLQYTYARIASILSKVDKQPEKNKINFSGLKSDEEKHLLKLIFNYPEILIKATQFYNPSNLANFLLELAQKFNSFYHQHPVIRADENIKQARLVLISAVAQVLKNGLKILGIETLDHM